MSRSITPARAHSASFALAVLTALVANPLAAQDSGIAVGAMAPESVMVETLDGQPLDLASYYGKGKPAVLEFWATWCPLCRKLEPTMQAARVKHDGRVTFVSVGVSANQTPERQKAHAEANKMSGEFVFDRNDLAQEAFTVPHTSYVVVLDGSGRVVYARQGSSQDIEAAVQKALSATAAP